MLMLGQPDPPQRHKGTKRHKEGQQRISKAFLCAFGVLVVLWQEVPRYINTLSPVRE